MLCYAGRLVVSKARQLRSYITHALPLEGTKISFPEALFTLIRINLKTHLFFPVWPFVHTKTAFSVAKNGTFWKRSPRWINLKTPARYLFAWRVHGEIWKKHHYGRVISLSLSVPFRPIRLQGGCCCCCCCCSCRYRLYRVWFLVWSWTLHSLIFMK